MNEYPDIIEYIIEYMLKSLNKIWLNDFEYFKRSDNNHIPVIVWKNLFHIDLYVIKKFPNCNKTLISNISHFWLISLTTFIDSNPTQIQIYNFSKKFLTESFNHFKYVQN